jgi:hypothetical protein
MVEQSRISDIYSDFLGVEFFEKWRCILEIARTEFCPHPPLFRTNYLIKINESKKS